MLHTLYLLCIAPFEFLMRLILEWGFSLTHSWGWSLVLLSLVVNTAILPIYNWAERRQEDERKLRRSMARHEAMLRECFKRQERFALLVTLRRLSGYTWGLALRGSLGLLVQIPFFIAAYQLLSTFSPLHGQHFGAVSDLGAPDAMMSFDTFRVNILPLVMTAVNLLAAFVYAASLTRRDKVQLYGIALLFLVLLYTAPSALVLYWTLNNVYSLVKTLAGKWWERSRIRRNAQKNYPQKGCSFLGDGGSVEGTWGHWRARFTTTVGYCFGVAALVWLYACTLLLLQRNEALVAGFNTAIWHFAGQCLVTACLASPAWVLLFPYPQCRAPAWYRTSLVASVALLFLLQCGFFRMEVAPENDHFPFSLWDSKGRQSFALWILGIFVAGRFLDKLLRLLAVVGKNVQTWLAVTDGMGEGTENPPVPSPWDSFILACVLGTVCGSFLWYFIPFCSYFHNINEFNFNAWDLFLTVTPWCLLTIAAITLICFFTTFFLPFQCTKFPWKQSSQDGCRVGIITPFILIILFILWLDGTILSFGLQPLDGRSGLFNLKSRMLIDSVIILILLLICCFNWRYIASNILVFLCIFSLIVLATLADEYLEREEKVVVNSFKGIDGLTITDEKNLYKKLSFSRSDNILILLADSLDTFSFEKSISEYPKIEKILEGFYIFRENIGVGGLTIQALPQILSGKIYNGESRYDFIQNALMGTESMAADAFKKRRKVFIDASFWHVIDDNKELLPNRKKIDLYKNMHFFYFRFMPYLGHLAKLNQ